MRGKKRKVNEKKVQFRRMSSTDPWSTSWPRRLRPCSVLERRLSRTTPEKRKLPCGDSGSEGSETGSDGEWSGDDDPLKSKC